MSATPPKLNLPNPAEIRARMKAEGKLAETPGLSESHAAPIEAPSALWGVERSVCGRLWRLKDVDLEKVQRLTASYDLPEVVARLLVGRGVESEDVPVTLNPTLKALMPDPSSLADMDKAAARIADAVTKSEQIAVFADYDVDGATSSSLMLRFLRALGADPMLYIPDRIAEGYGPNGPAMRHLAEKGAKLVITLDCGVTSFDALEAASEAGLEVVVIDHHQVGDDLPVAEAVVNPNRKDDSSGLGTLAAVGVTFMTLVAVSRELKARNWFENAGIPSSDLRQWLDLVALGTVCDVVPLQGLNRAFVVQGLKIMGQGANKGLTALGQVAGLSEPPGTYHLGFMLGPRVNAGGRVGKADDGARLLSSEDKDEIDFLARELDGLNRERQDIEKAVLAEAIAQAERELETWPERPVVFAKGADWHPGVIGIVASRLKDAFERPALVFSLADGLAKASGRSVKGADLGAAVLAAKEAGLLVAGGGHAMAAGLTAEEGKLEDLSAFLCERLSEDVAAARAEISAWVDATVSVQGATRALYDAVQQAGPYGAGNPEPVFAIRDALVDWVQPVGENHLRCTLATPEGTKLSAIAFRCVGQPLGQALEAARGRTAHVKGRLRADNWKGRNGVQFHIEDMAPVA